jgi:undecaprenyl-diphosphatase
MEAQQIAAPVGSRRHRGLLPLGNGIHGQVLFGSILSGVGAYLALRFLMRYFSDPKRTLTPFAIYSLAVGLGCLIYFSVR